MLLHKKLLLLTAIFFCFKINAQTLPYKQQLTVAQDGSGDYKTIQEAINAVRAYSPEHITITIKNGLYIEKVTIPAWVTNISFVGESRENTIISYADYSGKYFAKGADTLINKAKHSTFTSYTMWVQGNDVDIKNITIRNTAGRVGQAVALHVDGDRFVMQNCNLLGNQDTLLTANGESRQYYFNCYVEGTTDFIFGAATAVFQNCTIKSLANSFITAASTTAHQQFGYVFLNCKLIANEEAQKVFLGRPWRAYAKTVFIHCELGKHIVPEGWNNWSKKENEQTAYYAEYQNIGDGAGISQRTAWSKQLTDKEAKQYSLTNIFRKSTAWVPEINK